MNTKKISTLALIPALAWALGAHAATPAARTLDLTPPNFFSAQWQTRLAGPTLDDATDMPATPVVVTPALKDKWNTHFSTLGIGSIFWAAFHPTQAYTIVMPLQQDDSFSSDSGLSSPQ